jgi:hypothetical protein
MAGTDPRHAGIDSSTARVDASQGPRKGRLTRTALRRRVGLQILELLHSKQWLVRMHSPQRACLAITIRAGAPSKSAETPY